MKHLEPQPLSFEQVWFYSAMCRRDVPTNACIYSFKNINIMSLNYSYDLNEMRNCCLTFLYTALCE